MNVDSTTGTLQALLRQLDAAAPAPRAKPQPQTLRTTDAGPAKVTPDGDGAFDPNAPRGTYLNIVV